jgi:hypothetical protein
VPTLIESFDKKVGLIKDYTGQQMRVEGRVSRQMEKDQVLQRMVNKQVQYKSQKVSKNVTPDKRCSLVKERLLDGEKE